MPKLTGYFTTSDKRIYLDLRESMDYTDKMKKLTKKRFKINLENCAKILFNKKNKASCLGNSIGEYLYMLPKSGLTLKYKTYSITPQENELDQ